MQLLRQLPDTSSIGAGAAQPALPSPCAGKHVLPGKNQMRSHSSAAPLGSPLITCT